jgi:hypothetical protein
VGDVIGDMTSRRGRVGGMDPAGGSTTIHVEVPLAEVLTYAPDLTSMTGGRGDYQMTLLRYEEVPAHVAQQVIAVDGYHLASIPSVLSGETAGSARARNPARLCRNEAVTQQAHGRRGLRRTLVLRKKNLFPRSTPRYGHAGYNASETRQALPELPSDELSPADLMAANRC